MTILSIAKFLCCYSSKLTLFVALSFFSVLLFLQIGSALTIAFSGVCVRRYHGMRQRTASVVRAPAAGAVVSPHSPLPSSPATATPADATDHAGSNNPADDAAVRRLARFISAISRMYRWLRHGGAPSGSSSSAHFEMRDVVFTWAWEVEASKSDADQR